jgi:putative phosphoribosyl transferase
LNVTPRSESGSERTRSTAGAWRVPQRPVGAVLLLTAGSPGLDDEPERLLAEAISDAGFVVLTLDPGDWADGEPGGVGHRAAEVAGWLACQPVACRRPIGVIGWGTEAAAALWAAAGASESVGAVACQAAQAEDTAEALDAVRAPTLLTLGRDVWDEMGPARLALERMAAPHRMVVMPSDAGAASTAEAPVVGRLLARWFTEHLAVARLR